MSISARQGSSSIQRPARLPIQLTPVALRSSWMSLSGWRARSGTRARTSQRRNSSRASRASSGRNRRWRRRACCWFCLSSCSGRCLRCCSFRRCFSCSFLLRLSSGCSVREILVNRLCFDGMNLVIIPVRFGKLLFAQKQVIEPLAFTQLEILVHLNRLEWTDLDANLAAHADRDVDVEHLRIKLRFTHVIGLFVVTLDDVDALRRTFLLADFARHAAHAGMRIVAVKNEKRKIAVILRQRTPFLRILHSDQAFLLEVTSDKVPRRDGHPLEYACAYHRSTSPITIS